jgi:hypothetical protein
MDLDRIKENLDEKAPQLVKDNKGALVGALVGYFLSDNEKAKSLLLGAVAGALLIDKNKNEDEE